MKRLKNLARHPLTWFTLFVFFVLYRGIFFGLIAMPADTLAGSYFPWLDFKWGYVVGVPVINPPISDVFSTFYIWKDYLVELIRNRSIPLWNTLAFSGTPLLASFHWGVFFPANLLLLLPKYWGWNLYICLSTLFSGIFFYLYIKRYFKNSWFIIGGSIIFALAGPMTTWAEFGTGVWASSLVMLLLVIVDSILDDGNARLFPVFSLVLASLFFAGHAQIVTYAALLLPLYVLRKIDFQVIRNAGILVAFIIFGLLGVGVFAIQLLPSLDFLKLSIRAQENYAADFNYGLTPFLEGIRFWAADFFGHPTRYNHWSKLFYHEYSSFLGSITLPVIVSYFFTKRKKSEAVFFGIVLLASVVLLFNSPISRQIFSLPFPLLTYSSASRILFVTVLSAAVLYCFATKELLVNQRNRNVAMITAFILIWITLLGWVVAPQKYQFVTARNIVIPLGMLTVFILTLRYLKSKTLVALILTLLLAVDLGKYFLKYNPFVPTRLVFPETPALSFLIDHKDEGRIAIAKTNLLPPNTWMMYRLEAVEGYDPLRLLSYSHLFNLINKSDYFSKPSRYAELENFDPRYLDALNVRYFVTLRRDKVGVGRSKADVVDKHKYKLVFEDGTTQIYQSPTTNDRAYFPTKVSFATSEASMAALMSRSEFDPRSEAVIMGIPEPMNKPRNSGVTILEHSENLVKIETENENQNYLILADAYEPNWKVLIDGQNSSVLMANAGIRAVKVPSGKHLVVFKYLPNSFVKGLKISMSSLIAIFICLLVIFRLPIKLKVWKRTQKL